MHAELRPRAEAEGVNVDALAASINSRKAVIGVVGMGYVGQPLAIGAHTKGFHVIGFDIDPIKVGDLNAGRSGIGTIPDHQIAEMRQSGRFRATGVQEDLSQIAPQV